ncbi:hypothetical protein jhhlp_003251 [Lomentospora prolificans]|uniref:WW-domain-binding protein n=1 Tax=Lomentospora prolificans TaxID=41688 RepID=A0A2N3NGG0_9PEZI|nr:hypothetical protein jhhlp_003251 [Lomentospora prolificans]
MTDQYLQEQHTYAIARNAPPETAPVNPVPDERTSWVMLSRSGEIVRLPHEHILHSTGSRVSIDLTVPKSLQGRTPTPFSMKSDNGIAYITNQRVIYLPSKPTEEFKSFAAPILNFEDSHISSPWFGSWYWVAVVTPVSQGGISPDIARVEVKLTFKDGGHNEFRNKFEELKERLHHVREIERETGQNIRIPDEPLPAYEAPPDATGSSHLAPQPVPARSDSSASRGRAPDEPPPGYEEAQAQTISMRLEDHIRDAADRGSEG